jgi:hypothetical protein
MKNFLNQTLDKKGTKKIITWFLNSFGPTKTSLFLEELKSVGFHQATISGLSLGFDDLKIPTGKEKLLETAEISVLDFEKKFQKGKITAVERYQKLLDIWTTASETLKDSVIQNFQKLDILNPLYMMAFSGARGNISQVRQLVGMRGLMSDSAGGIIDFPIRRNFREGLTVTEYAISCYGARKGLIDTALRTADSGYLTRRLVDVAHGILIGKIDCKTVDGFDMYPLTTTGKSGTESIVVSLEKRIIGRILAEPELASQEGVASSGRASGLAEGPSLRFAKRSGGPSFRRYPLPLPPAFGGWAQPGTGASRAPRAMPNPHCPISESRGGLLLSSDSDPANRVIEITPLIAEILVSKAKKQKKYTIRVRSPLTCGGVGDIHGFSFANSGTITGQGQPSSWADPAKTGDFDQPRSLGRAHSEGSAQYRVSKRDIDRNPENICQLCYGWSLAHARLVSLGDAVGVLAAQSIGEPGTQLTMRTFHTGGIFSTELEAKIFAPQEGYIGFSKTRPKGKKIRTFHGQTAFFTFEPIQLKIYTSVGSSSEGMLDGALRAWSPVGNAANGQRPMQGLVALPAEKGFANPPNPPCPPSAGSAGKAGSAGVQCGFGDGADYAHRFASLVACGQCDAWPLANAEAEALQANPGSVVTNTESDLVDSKSSIFYLPKHSLIFVSAGQKVFKQSLCAEISHVVGAKQNSHTSALESTPLQLGPSLRWNRPPSAGSAGNAGSRSPENEPALMGLMPAEGRFGITRSVAEPALMGKALFGGQCDQALRRPLAIRPQRGPGGYVSNGLSPSATNGLWPTQLTQQSGGPRSAQLTRYGYRPVSERTSRAPLGRPPESADGVIYEVSVDSTLETKESDKLRFTSLVAFGDAWPSANAEVKVKSINNDLASEFLTQRPEGSLLPSILIGSDQGSTKPDAYLKKVTSVSSSAALRPGQRPTPRTDSKLAKNVKTDQSFSQSRPLALVSNPSKKVLSDIEGQVYFSNLRQRQVSRYSEVEGLRGHESVGLVTKGDPANGAPPNNSFDGSAAAGGPERVLSVENPCENLTSLLILNGRGLSTYPFFSSGDFFHNLKKVKGKVKEIDCVGHCGLRFRGKLGEAHRSLKELRPPSFGYRPPNPHCPPNPPKAGNAGSAGNAGGLTGRSPESPVRTPRAMPSKLVGASVQGFAPVRTPRAMPSKLVGAPILGKQSLMPALPAEPAKGGQCGFGGQGSEWPEANPRVRNGNCIASNRTSEAKGQVLGGARHWIFGVWVTSFIRQSHTGGLLFDSYVNPPKSDGLLGLRPLRFTSFREVKILRAGRLGYRPLKAGDIWLKKLKSISLNEGSVLLIWQSLLLETGQVKVGKGSLLGNSKAKIYGHSLTSRSFQRNAVPVTSPTRSQVNAVKITQAYLNNFPKIFEGNRFRIPAARPVRYSYKDYQLPILTPGYCVTGQVASQVRSIEWPQANPEARRFTFSSSAKIEKLRPSETYGACPPSAGPYFVRYESALNARLRRVHNALAPSERRQRRPGGQATGLRLGQTDNYQESSPGLSRPTQLVFSDQRVVLHSFDTGRSLGGAPVQGKLGTPAFGGFGTVAEGDQARHAQKEPVLTHTAHRRASKSKGKGYVVSRYPQNEAMVFSSSRKSFCAPMPSLRFAVTSPPVGSAGLYRMGFGQPRCGVLPYKIGYTPNIKINASSSLDFTSGLYRRYEPALMGIENPPCPLGSTGVQCGFVLARNPVLGLRPAWRAMPAESVSHVSNECYTTQRSEGPVLAKPLLLSSKTSKGFPLSSIVKAKSPLFRSRVITDSSLVLSGEFRDLLVPTSVLASTEPAGGEWPALRGERSYDTNSHWTPAEEGTAGYALQAHQGGCAMTSVGRRPFAAEGGQADIIPVTCPSTPPCLPGRLWRRPEGARAPRAMPNPPSVGTWSPKATVPINAGSGGGSEITSDGASYSTLAEPSTREEPTSASLVLVPPGLAADSGQRSEPLLRRPQNQIQGLLLQTEHQRKFPWTQNVKKNKMILGTCWFPVENATPARACYPLPLRSTGAPPSTGVKPSTWAKVCGNSIEWTKANPVKMGISHQATEEAYDFPNNVNTSSYILSKFLVRKVALSKSYLWAQDHPVRFAKRPPSVAIAPQTESAAVYPYRPPGPLWGRMARGQRRAWSYCPQATERAMPNPPSAGTWSPKATVPINAGGLSGLCEPYLPACEQGGSRSNPCPVMARSPVSNSRGRFTPSGRRQVDLRHSSSKVNRSTLRRAVTYPEANLQIVLRKFQSYTFSSHSPLFVKHGDIVLPRQCLFELIYQQSKTGDIVQGLPKIEELFEARRTSAHVIESIHSRLKQKFDELCLILPLYEATKQSIRFIQRILVDEIQLVYQSQGVEIGDKHIEIIVRQMTSKVIIHETGKTSFFPDDIINFYRIPAPRPTTRQYPPSWSHCPQAGNAGGLRPVTALTSGHSIPGGPASSFGIVEGKFDSNQESREPLFLYEPIVLGITKIAFFTESFVSAASFQEAKRVLMQCALESRVDFLHGLKENVILGRFIQAGTGSQ